MDATAINDGAILEQQKKFYWWMIKDLGLLLSSK
jgi:hypothetical protein